MASSSIKPVRKRGTNVSLREDLVAQARDLGIGLSSACESGLAAAVKTELERRWIEEHGDALRANSEFIERNGMPLRRFRRY